MNNEEDDAPKVDTEKELLQLRLKAASLQMTLTALQSNLSENVQRARHAEEMVSMLQTQGTMEQVAQLVMRHMDERSKDRSVHQQALIQTTAFSLNAALQGNEAELRALVNTVVQGLTRASQTMHEIELKENEQAKRQYLTKMRGGIDGTTSGH
jgi:cobalamin biosynthesis protein CbiD